MGCQIRQLTVADRKRLSQLVEKLTKVAGDSSLLNVISSASAARKNKDNPKADKGGNDQIIQVMVQVFHALLTTLEEETQEWFADLIGVSIEEFLAMPIDTEPRIIEQIVNAQESSSFFTIASRLYSKIGQFKSKLSKEKNKSDSETE